MMARTLKMAFWITYDHLGKLLVANLLSVLVLLFPGSVAYAALATGAPGLALVIGAPMLVLVFGLLGPMLAAGMAYMIKEFIDTRDGSLRTFFCGIRRYAWRAARLGALFVGLVCCLGTSAWFYASRLGVSLPWLGFTLSALALWCLAFVGLSALYVIPALVQKEAGVWATAKLSALLVLDNPLFTIGLGLYWVFLAGLALMPPLLLLFSLAPQVVLLSSAYEMLARKYALAEAAASVAAAGAADGGEGTGPGEIMGILKDEDDDYLNRGFRDFLFPWKG